KPWQVGSLCCATARLSILLLSFCPCVPSSFNLSARERHKPPTDAFHNTPSAVNYAMYTTEETRLRWYAFALSILVSSLRSPSVPFPALLRGSVQQLQYYIREEYMRWLEQRC
ncbi:unnamed protein product, partial [Ectocarpus sp. 13 AM-2016]